MKRIVLEVEDDFHQEVKEKVIKARKTMRQVLTDLLKGWVSNTEVNHESNNDAKQKLGIRSKGTKKVIKT